MDNQWTKNLKRLRKNIKRLRKEEEKKKRPTEKWVLIIIEIKIYRINNKFL